MKLLIISLYCLITLSVNAKVLHSEKSLYRNIIVEQKSDKRCMVFGQRSRHPDYQSCFNTNDPEHLVFSYTKLILGGLSLIQQPQSILILGLGGGTLPITLEKMFPNSLIDTVEIDQAVHRVAKKWFNYQESENQVAHILDGRVFVKRQIRKSKQYDLIILDAFNGDYIPEHLMTQEFLSEVQQLLSLDGLLIANTFSRNKLYDYESVTYQNVFGLFKYIHSTKSGNRIIYAGNKNQQKHLGNFKSSKEADYLVSIGVDLEEFNRQLISKPDWNQNVRPLTDQFSPANLLNQ